MKYLELLRPRQWIKNVFLFAGLVFSRQFLELNSVITSILAFFVFSALSSGVYILNDIIDFEEDKLHPVKSKRPIAAGTISKQTTSVIAAFLVGIALFLAFVLNIYFLYICVIYFLIMILYSLRVKHIIVMDVLFVAAGFVLRAIAGAVVINVEISSWLLLCTLLLALFLAVSKRRTEIVVLGHKAIKHRRILSQYSIDLLNQMIAIVTSACIVSYCLYTLAPETVAKFHTRNLIFTVPLVIYGVFRYLYLTYKKVHTDIPEKILITDLPLQICVILWVVTCIVILIRF